jgi:hypothetical protein
MMAPKIAINPMKMTRAAVFMTAGYPHYPKRRIQLSD